MDSYLWTHQCWPTIINLSAHCRHYQKWWATETDGKREVKGSDTDCMPWWWWWWRWFLNLFTFLPLCDHLLRESLNLMRKVRFKHSDDMEDVALLTCEYSWAKQSWTKKKALWPCSNNLLSTFTRTTRQKWSIENLSLILCINQWPCQRIVKYADCTPIWGVRHLHKNRRVLRMTLNWIW